MTNRPLIAVACLAALAGCKSDVGFYKDLPQWNHSIAPPVKGITQSDEIMQVTTPKVDILWTIDNSCSMADNQNDLAAAFPGFMDYFLGSGLDYHIGVTSTDIDRAYSGAQGSLKQDDVTGLKYIDNDTPDPIGVYQRMATLGTGGSGTEKGLGGTYECLELKRDTVNAGFYRDESAIHTIIISDEPEQTQSSIISASEFTDWYDSLKQETDMRSFSSVIDPNVGGGYSAQTTAIGGILWDINADNWPELLERLGVQAAGLKREYFLSHLPVPGSIEVKIRDVGGAELSFVEASVDPATGQVVDANQDGLITAEGDGDWYYTAERNSITFIEYIPNSLSTIVIDYTVLASQQGQVDVE